MPRIVVTPWRQHKELLEVRDWLLPGQNQLPQAISLDKDSTAIDDNALKRKACDTVHDPTCDISVWKVRGHLPHAIESTWLLTEAALADLPISQCSHISVFSLKAGYITALTRFVTALLDASQTAKFKVSMYAKAGELGLPAMFVDLRHEATHGEMPTLSVLRDANAKALVWLWEHYWRELGSHEGCEIREPEDGGTASGDEGFPIEPWGPSRCSGKPRGIGML